MPLSTDEEDSTLPADGTRRAERSFTWLRVPPGRWSKRLYLWNSIQHAYLNRIGCLRLRLLKVCLCEQCRRPIYPEVGFRTRSLHALLAMSGWLPAVLCYYESRRPSCPKPLTCF